MRGGPETGSRHTLLAAAVLLAGCGGGGGAHLRAADANRLIALAHRIGHESACAQAHDVPQLRARAIALVNAQRVPAELQEPLLSGVAALQAPLCLPPVAASAPPVRAPAPAPARRPHGHEHHHKHGKGGD